MLVKIKFLLFLSQCSLSLLIPLAQQGVSISSSENSQIGKKSIHNIETIQQIDVKDENKRVISDINNIIISDDNVVTVPSKNTENTQNNIPEAEEKVTNNETNTLMNGTTITTKASTVIEDEIKWRIDTFKKSDNDGILKTNAKLDNQTREPDNIYMIVNTKTIDDFSVNSSDSDNVQIKNGQLNSNNNGIGNLNPNDTELIRKLINSTIGTIVNAKNIFVILNSGNITNFRLNSPVSGTSKMSKNVKERARRQTTISTTTGATVDLKFRNGENEKQNGEALNPAENDTIVSSLDNETKDILNAKTAELQNNNPGKNNNIVIRLAPGTEPIKFSLNQIPMNQILTNAMDLMKRFKRSTHDRKKIDYPPKQRCKSKHNDNRHIEHNSKHSKPDDLPLKSDIDLSFRTLNDDVAPSFESTVESLRSSAKSVGDVLNKVQSVELVCPLSVVVNIYMQTVLRDIAKNENFSYLNSIITSFLRGNKDVIDLITAQLTETPLPVQVRLQLLHGDSKNLIEELKTILDATLCALT